MISFIGRLLRMYDNDTMPVEPHIRMNTLSIEKDHPELTFFCGVCGCEMVHKYSGVPIEEVKKNYRYCHHCGRQVLWR